MSPSSYVAVFSTLATILAGIVCPVLGTSADGRTIVRFRSRIIGRTMTIRIRQSHAGSEYDGEGKDVTTQGKIRLDPVDARQTRVTMQTTSEVHGLAGAFASEGMKRDRARKKLRSDLEALRGLAGVAPER